MTTYTEQEAAHHWCPFARGKRLGKDSSDGCIGSFCMGWQWSTVWRPVRLPNGESAAGAQPAAPTGRCGFTQITEAQ